MLLTTISAVSLLLYLAAALLLLLRFAGYGPVYLRRRKIPALVAGWGAAGTHTYVLYALVFTRRGLDLGIFNTASLVGLLVALIALMTLVRRAFENLGLVLFPAAGISVILARAFPGDKLFVPDTGWPLDAHILISLIAYSLLSVGAVQALVLAIQEYGLRHKIAGGVFSALPPLEVMERFLFQMIAAGFVLLSLALFTGFIFVHNLFAQHLVHKTVLSVLAWLVFAILLWGRYRFGWRGRTAIRWTLSGFAALMLAYFGSKFVLELILGRHWGLM